MQSRCTTLNGSTHREDKSSRWKKKRRGRRSQDEVQETSPSSRSQGLSERRPWRRLMKAKIKEEATFAQRSPLITTTCASLWRNSRNS
ncbi:hypothetical protein CEXT_463191 [Caerostris extrusa]|uniref:Uncharacterized protein n=1 Tax=Caerostris extrusa TaxID=172846 RepID=A0AAV4S8M6_CAEEX|nr:hypothetical protein CEXT_463191 [Caerostris extrusa]